MADDPEPGDARGGTAFVEPQAGFQDRFRRAMDCVCRVDINRNASGTGFLVGPSTVLTNFHVVEPALRDEVSGVSCLFDFVADPAGGMRAGARVNVVRLVARSPYGLSENQGKLLELEPGTSELDFALLRLESEQGRTAAPAAARARGWLPLPTALPRVARDAALYIVQHPAGGPAVVAWDAQGIRGFSPDRGDRLVHKVRTSPGSSGSGCFNERWELVALHNYGDPAWGSPLASFGRGIPIHLIRAEIVRQDFEADIPAVVEAADVDSVAAVLRTLAAAVKGDERLTARVGKSREVLAKIATHLQFLVAYKALHDFLHEVQKTTVPSLFSLLVADSDEAVHAIADSLVINLGGCREEAGRARPDGSESGRRQLEWIDEMEAVAIRLRDGASEADGKRVLVDQIRRIARRRLARLNNALVAEACDIDLHEFGSVLRDALAAARPGGGAPEADSLERLSLELDRLVTEHQFWQDLENDLQGLEDRVRDDRSVIDRQGFCDLWRASWEQIQDACGRDLAAPWATNLLALGHKVQALVADLAWDLVGRAFGDFRRPAFQRFYKVDKDLLAHSHEIGRLGEPLQSLLRLV